MRAKVHLHRKSAKNETAGARVERESFRVQIATAAAEAAAAEAAAAHAAPTRTSDDVDDDDDEGDGGVLVECHAHKCTALHLRVLCGEYQ